MSEQISNICAVDDGNRNIKLVYKGIKLCIPSRIQVGPLSILSIGGGETENREYTIKGKGGDDDSIFSVGPDLDSSVHVASDDYYLSDYNRVLVYHTLKKAGVTGNVNLVTGLPVKNYYSGRGGVINSSLVKRKDESLKKNNIYSSSKGSLSDMGFKIVSSDTLAEAISSWMDIVIESSPDGSLSFNSELISKRIAIVDIGGRTTDITVIKDFNIDLNRSTTVDYGMLKIRDTLKDVFLERYEREFSIPLLDKAIETGQVENFGDVDDVSEDIFNLRESAAKVLLSDIKRVLGNGADLYKIVFVGGGSIDLYDRFLKSAYPKNGEIAKDPLFTNAYGMYKFGVQSL